ncbi:MAG: chemotaxis protein CheC [Solirubrobacteraceae bacterium]
MANARYSDLQLDALRELANIGSGTAGTALSSLLGCPIELSVPSASALELADAVEAAGEAGDLVWGVVVPVTGRVDATALLVIPEADAATVCAMLGVDPDTETGRSALGEIGNIMVSSYVGALATMTGFELDLRPPQSTRDMRGAIVSSALACHSDEHELALVLDSELEVAGEACTLSFMLLPTPAGVAELLHRIGLGD